MPAATPAAGASWRGATRWPGSRSRPCVVATSASRRSSGRIDGRITPVVSPRKWWMRPIISDWTLAR